MNNSYSCVKRGEIYYADLGVNDGSIQSGIRPVLIIQNDVGNKFSPTVIVVPLTSQSKKNMPTHVLFGTETGLTKPSVCLCEQITVIDKSDLRGLIGKATNLLMSKVNTALCISMNIYSKAG